MLLFKRPTKPSDFDEKMEPHRQAVADLVVSGKNPVFNEKTWQGYKEHFSDVQHGKCCFCEAYVIATSHGPVEHYRPKSEVSTLADRGEEIAGTPKVRGRRVRPITHGPLRQGYWWLAYEWTNWLFSCTICNSTWKKTLFPLAGTPRPQSPGPGVDDRPLLLHPYGKAEPGRHLRFTEFGQIEGLTRKGRETIRTLGLDRLPLLPPRGKIADRIYYLIDMALHRYDAGEEPDPTTMQDILREGAVDIPHAGMVRIIFEEWIPMTWAELEQRYGSAEIH